jgi:hypothetical protein
MHGNDWRPGIGSLRIVSGNEATLKASEQGPQETIRLDTEVVLVVDRNPISYLFLYRKLDPIERFARIDGERGVWLFNSL